MMYTFYIVPLWGSACQSATRDIGGWISGICRRTFCPFPFLPNANRRPFGVLPPPLLGIVPHYGAACQNAIMDTGEWIPICRIPIGQGPLPRHCWAMPKKECVPWKMPWHGVEQQKSFWPRAALSPPFCVNPLACPEGINQWNDGPVCQSAIMDTEEWISGICAVALFPMPFCRMPIGNRAIWSLHCWAMPKKECAMENAIEQQKSSWPRAALSLLFASTPWRAPRG